MKNLHSPDYFNRYEHLQFTRSANGILEVRFVTDNGPIVFTGKDHHEFVEAFHAISRDKDNKVVILTGTGDEWFAQIDGPSLGDITNPRVWYNVWWEGQKVLQNLLDIDVPVIVALNGPATVHSEYALTGDILLATGNTYFQDFPHLALGIVPGDGIQTVWTRAIGEYRAKYFLYTRQKITAQEAKELGVVSEVLSNQETLMKRAYEVADQLLAIPELTRRFMRSMFAQGLKEAFLKQVGLGLSIEGVNGTDLKIAAESNS